MIGQGRPIKVILKQHGIVGLFVFGPMFNVFGSMQDIHRKAKKLTGRDDQLTYVTSFALFYALLQIFQQQVNFQEFRDKFQIVTSVTFYASLNTSMEKEP